MHDYRETLSEHLHSVKPQDTEIHKVDGALILDCNAVLRKTTEGMAELAASSGLRASQRLLYQRLNRHSLDDWMRTYGFRSSPQLKP